MADKYDLMSDDELIALVGEPSDEFSNMSDDELIAYVQQKESVAQEKTPDKFFQDGDVKSSLVGLATGGIAGFMGQRSSGGIDEQEKIVENRIKNREDVLKQSIEYVSQNPLKAAVETGISPSKVIGDVQSGIAQRAEAAISNVAMALQNKKDRSIVGDFISGLTGKRLGKMADVYEKAGMPKIQSELAGLVTNIALGYTAGSAGKKVVDLPKNSPFVRGMFKRLGKSDTHAKFMGDVRGSFFKQKHDISNSFDEAITNIEKADPMRRASLKRQVSDFIVDMNENPSTARAVESIRKKSEILDLVLTDPNMAENLTIRDMITLKNDIKRFPGLQAKLRAGKFGNYTVDDIPIIDFLDEIKGAQLGAFPEVEVANKAYSEQLNMYNQVKSQFKNPETLWTNLKTKFNKNPEIYEAVKKILKPEVMREIGGFSTATSILKSLGVIGAGGVAYGGIKKIAGGMQ